MSPIRIVCRIPAAFGHSSLLQGDVLVPVGKNIGIERLGWHTFSAQLPFHARCLRGSHRGSAETNAPRTGKQNDALREYLHGRKRKAHGAVVQMVLLPEGQARDVLRMFPLRVGLRGVFDGNLGVQKSILILLDCFGCGGWI